MNRFVLEKVGNGKYVIVDTEQSEPFSQHRRYNLRLQYDVDELVNLINIMQSDLEQKEEYPVMDFND